MCFLKAHVLKALSTYGCWGWWKPWEVGRSKRKLPLWGLAFKGVLDPGPFPSLSLASQLPWAKQFPLSHVPYPSTIGPKATGPMNSGLKLIAQITLSPGILPQKTNTIHIWDTVVWRLTQLWLHCCLPAAQMIVFGFWIFPASSHHRMSLGSVPTLRKAYNLSWHYPQV